MTTTRAAAGAAAAVLAAAAPVWAWGDVGHVLTSEAAARALPADAAGVFGGDLPAELGHLGPEPDRWRVYSLRALDRGAAPDHFVDLELATGLDLTAPPPDRYAFAEQVRAAGKKPAEVGFAPYRAIELCQRLEVEVATLLRARGEEPAARSRRAAARAAAVYTAGILGHYVADLTNPHHTTIHFNGWKGDNPEGFATDRDTHWRFEEDFVGRVEERLTAAVTAPVRGELDYVRAVWELVAESNGLVVTLYRLDGSGAFARGAEATPEAEQGVAFASERLVRGATLLRDLWATAVARGRLRAQAADLREAVQAALDAAGFEQAWAAGGAGGVVSLVGRVESPGEAARARALAAAVPGVAEVRLRLQVLY